MLQYAGDSLLAVFGAVEAREDDAERAVRCGLAMLDQGRQLDGEVLAAHGHAGFNVRVGIHSGGVLLGGGVDAEGTIRGIAVSIAARLEQAATPGALLISHDTLAQVRGIFEVEAQVPLAVKRLAQPLQKLPEIPATLRKLLSGGAEGNPFYMEELVKLIDRLMHRAEVVRIDGDSYRAKEAQEREAQRLAERSTKTGTARSRKPGR